MLSPTDIIEIAQHHGLEPALVRAVISVESSGNQFAWRTEHHYRYLWDVQKKVPFRKITQQESQSEQAPIDFRAKIGSRNTEWVGQQASWGPMQIMGAVARELGFEGHFPELCGLPGVEYGCKKLSKLVDRYYDKYGMEGVVAAYNAGSPILVAGRYANRDYVNKVFRLYRGE